MKICPICKKTFDDSVNFCPHEGEVLEDDLSSIIGTTLDGQYQIEALLGKGSMGAVYRARHILLGDCVAIKVMSAHMRSNPLYLRRFRREAQAARRFHHPNAIAVYDLRNTNDGMIYMVLEYIEGHTLRAELNRRRRFSPVEAFLLLEPIANALNAAHSMGVIHRDLKPDNIMLGKSAEGQPVVKLLDLGLAKLSQTSETGASGESVLTVAGQILGTPYYMPPEQWGFYPDDGNPEIDGRADIYSLGVVFYELISGRRPFEGKTTQDLVREHMTTTAAPLHEIIARVPEAFGLAIARAMSKKRSDRQSTCAELIEQLREALQTSAENRTSWDPVQFSQEQFLVDRADTPSELAEITVLQSNIPTLQKDAQGSQSIEPAMRTFEFFVVTVNSGGETIERRLGQAQSFTEDLGHGVLLEMVSVPGGRFLMGSPEIEDKRAGDEGPQHQVSLPRFLMGKFEVTQAQWRIVAAMPKISRPLTPDPSRYKGDNLPVERVSWDDCLEFCARLSRKTGRNYNLPSEAQWEYACRAGTVTPFHLGETITPDLVNYDGNYPYNSAPKGVYREQTTSVGSLGVANAFGLYDMHGNVWEWCADTWHEDYSNAPEDGSVWMVGGNYTLRVLRGGSWYSRGNGCRSALRYADRPDSRDDNIGFRVVLSLE
jgi:eukaryotic-like serine/threonine-protein kinase